MYIGSYDIDDVLTFYCNTTRVDTGSATDADAVPTYRVYEEETGTPIVTGSMALLDSSNTAAFYSEQITLSAANGFERGKCYAIYLTTAVNSIIGSSYRQLQIGAKVDLRYWMGSAPSVLQSGRVDAYVGAMAAGVIAAATFAANALDAVWSTTTRTLSAFAFSVTVGTNNDKTGYGLSAAAIQAIWDALTSVLTTVGSIGKLLVDNVNATISSRASQTAVDDMPTNAEFDARTIVAANYATAAAQATAQADLDIVTGADGVVIASGTQTFNMTGDITGSVSGSVDSVTDPVTVGTNNDKTGYGLSAAAVTAVWAYVSEGTWTIVQQVRLWSSILLGQASGMGTTTGTFRDIDNTKNRVVVTQDTDGNRSAFGTKDGT